MVAAPSVDVAVDMEDASALDLPTETRPPFPFRSTPCSREDAVAEDLLAEAGPFFFPLIYTILQGGRGGGGSFGGG